MRRFLVATVRRRCPADEPSGYLYLVDPQRGAVLQRSDIVEPLYRALDRNPRGGMRGAKGISVRPDQIALANYSLIQRYDSEWNLLGAISHPSAAGIHDILFEGDHLWVAAAHLDLLARFSLDGTLERGYYLRQPSPALRDLGWNPPVLLTPAEIFAGKLDFRHPLNVEKETYDRAHVNSVCRLPDGGLIVSLGFVFNDSYAHLLRLKNRLVRWGVWSFVKAGNQRLRQALGKRQKNVDPNLLVKPAKAQSALVRLAEDGRHTLTLKLAGVTAPSHSLLALPDGSLVYLNTSTGEALHVDPQRGRVISADLLDPQGFLRGVAPLDERRLLIGSRRRLLVYDLPGRRVQDSFEISKDPEEAVYDIKELPEHYAPPPASFAGREA